MEQINSSAPRVVHSETEKQQHIRHWVASGQSRQAYSKAHGLSYGTFKDWVAKYHRPSAASGDEPLPGFISVDLGPGISHTSAYAEIHYPNGARLIIHRPIAIEELRRLML